MRILFLSHHWSNNSHHSKYGGFQRMVFHAAKDNEVTLVTWGKEEAAYRDEHGIMVRTIKSTGRGFLFSKRVRISREGKRISGGFDVIHALYSDCAFALPDNSFVVTFHVLPGIAVYTELKQRIFIVLKNLLLQRRAMERAKEIVCVSNNLLGKIPPKYRDKAQFIPHGIDTGFWDPRLSAASSNTFRKPYVLCVGSHGLDTVVMKEFISGNPSTEFILVGVKKRLGDFPNSHYRENIPDEELRDLYCHAGAVIKPLLFATANNSVLEAMAMGKTIIASRIPGITDYLNESTCIFIDTLKGRSLDGLVALTLNPLKIREKAVKTYSWEVVFEKYLVLYNKDRNLQKGNPLSNG